MIPCIFFLLSELHLRQDAIPFSPYELFRVLFTELMSVIQLWNLLLKNYLTHSSIKSNGRHRSVIRSEFCMQTIFRYSSFVFVFPAPAQAKREKVFETEKLSRLHVLTVLTNDSEYTMKRDFHSSVSIHNSVITNDRDNYSLNDLIKTLLWNYDYFLLFHGWKMRRIIRGAQRRCPPEYIENTS